MIYSVKGILTYVEPTFAVVECGGVGFKCYASMTTITSLSPVGNEVSLLTYMSIREDAMDLYGFSAQNELNAFKLLISISGVGPKAAISILSALTPDKLAIAVSSGDVKSIQAAQGIGKKTADRIVLELRDKMGNVVSNGASSVVEGIQNVTAHDNSREAVEVLVSLGYSQSEASAVVGTLDPTLSVDEMIRKGLKSLAANL